MSRACAEFADVEVVDTMIAAYQAALLQQEQERIEEEDLLKQGEADALIARLLIKSIISSGNEKIGKIGEKFAAENVVGALDLLPTRFAAAKHGFDNVFTDSRKGIVVLESKCTTGSPLSALHTTKHHGKQLDDEWIGRQAELMQKQSSAQYSIENASLGKQIHQAIEDHTIRAILVHTNPETGVVTLYERVSEGKFDMLYQWELGDSND